MRHQLPSSVVPQHSLLRSFLLHVLPGALTTTAFLVFRPLLHGSGTPPLLAFLLAVLLVDLPLLLGVMLFEGKTLNGRFSLEGAVLYRDMVPWKTFVGVFVGAFVVVCVLTMLLAPLNAWLTERLFSWLPGWMFLEEQTQYQAYAKSVLLAIFSLQLALTGVALPWVEELYFRGYLLPRLSRYGRWAPLLGGRCWLTFTGWKANERRSLFSPSERTFYSSAGFSANRETSSGICHHTVLVVKSIQP
jgi:membrane protease YdiL (CAAX protease family)